MTNFSFFIYKLNGILGKYNKIPQLLPDNSTYGDNSGKSQYLKLNLSSSFGAVQMFCKGVPFSEYGRTSSGVSKCQITNISCCDHM
jgi:hypothetical protein